MQNFVLPYLYTNPIGLKEHLPPRVCLLTCGIEYYLRKKKEVLMIRVLS